MRKRFACFTPVTSDELRAFQHRELVVANYMALTFAACVALRQILLPLPNLVANAICGSIILVTVLFGVTLLRQADAAIAARHRRLSRCRRFFTQTFATAWGEGESDDPDITPEDWSLKESFKLVIVLAAVASIFAIIGIDRAATAKRAESSDVCDSGNRGGYPRLRYVRVDRRDEVWVPSPSTPSENSTSAATRSRAFASGAVAGVTWTSNSSSPRVAATLS
jgi:hypothetical protein